MVSISNYHNCIIHGNFAIPLLYCKLIITGRNEVVAKVIFLHLSVIHSVHRGGEGVCLSACWDTTPPQDQTPPPRTRQTPPPYVAEKPWKQTPAYGLRTPPPSNCPPGSRLQHTVYERPVRILLECILVMNYFPRKSYFIGKNAFHPLTN